MIERALIALAGWAERIGRWAAHRARIRRTRRRIAQGWRQGWGP